MMLVGCLQWVVQGAVEVDIGANPSAEGGEDEGVDDQAVKVVDIVYTFRLQVAPTSYLLDSCLLWMYWMLIALPICRNNLPSIRSSLSHLLSAT